MKYVSTRSQQSAASFHDVLMSGLAPDGGLFVPERWVPLAPLSKSDSYIDVAEKVIGPYVTDLIPQSDLRRILEETYSDAVFTSAAPAPLRPLDENTYLMELFHGPTLAFKDVALQFLGRVFDYALKESGEHLTIIGATSGDTGSAAIEACKGRDNISVYILHPHGRTSEVQRRQMTSVLADNVHNIALDGTFDDCQLIVKQAFGDTDLRTGRVLSAINSINWARIIAQSVYYAYAGAQFDVAPAFAVPTGNFGNIYAAYVAKSMGANIGPLIIGSNRNDVLTRFFETGEMSLGPVIPSLSPSMDIQVSSNFERYLYDVLDRDTKTVQALMAELKTTDRFMLSAALMTRARTDFAAYRCSDEDTITTIRDIYTRFGEIIDPHTAVGVNALAQARAHGRAGEPNVPAIALACAHPAKFPDAVKRATSQSPSLPPHLADLRSRPERFTVLPNSFEAVKSYIMKS